MEDKILVCKDCENEFKFSVGEQRFYEEKGFGAPIRCKDCRAEKKARNEAKNNEDTSIDDLLKKFQNQTVKL